MHQQKKSPKLTTFELKAALGYSSIFAVRMLGLFMIFPVFAVFAASQYSYTTPALMGLAIGIYGIAQALLQIPFGLLSDRFGRKKIIIIGLLLFAAGSLIAALADNIYQVILGRLVQGSGAIGSTVLAAISDSTRDVVRNKVMGIVGISIGFSFVLAFVLGPLVVSYFGIGGIFTFSFISTILATMVLLSLPSNNVAGTRNLVNSSISKNLTAKNAGLCTRIFRALSNKTLLRFNLGIFVLHANLASLFLVIPNWLAGFNISGSSLTWYYLAIFGLVAFITFPLLAVVDRTRSIKKPQYFAFLGLIFAGFMLMMFNFNLVMLIIAMVLFFVSFNFLESSLPASISKLVAANHKGLSLGVYSSLQFLGIFFGGFVGGILNAKFGAIMVVGFAIALSMIWLLITLAIDFVYKTSNKDLVT